jgi:Fe-S-cluster-containing hydrogenase component 2
MRFRAGEETMIANYGYKDGSGEYYISIDTDKCIDCPAARACLTGCPKQMFETMTDDYDDEVVAVKAAFRRSIGFDCADCKPAGGYASLPCTTACTPGAIKHSW